MACDHEKVRQGEGSLVCIDPTCPDVAHADLVSSCCLVEPREENGRAICSECGTPTERADPFTTEEHAEVAKALRQTARFKRELGQGMKGGQLYASGETTEHAEKRQAKASHNLTQADRLEALAAKMEA